MVYYNARCVFCNLFMSYDDMANSSVAYTPYGSSQDYEPPDEEWGHLQCWTDRGEKWRQLTYSVSWCKPMINEDGESFPAYCEEETQ